MAAPSELPQFPENIAIKPEALRALEKVVPCVRASFSPTIASILSQQPLSQGEWKELHDKIEVQITADRTVMSLREAKGKMIGAVIAVALFASLFFAVPAIAGNLCILLLTAFVISLMTVGIFLITIDWVNSEELERTYALERFLQHMPPPR